MTRQEFSGKRDLTFSGWIRENLPDSATGYLVTDLDFILFNWKTKKIMLLEVKQYKKQIRMWQKKLYQLLHTALSRGLPKDVEYLGTHLITFEKNDFKNNVWFDKSVVTEEQLKAKLSF